MKAATASSWRKAKGLPNPEHHGAALGPRLHLGTDQRTSLDAVPHHTAYSYGRVRLTTRREHVLQLSRKQRHVTSSCKPSRTVPEFISRSARRIYRCGRASDTGRQASRANRDNPPDDLSSRRCGKYASPGMDKNGLAGLRATLEGRPNHGYPSDAANGDERPGTASPLVRAFAAPASHLRSQRGTLQRRARSPRWLPRKVGIRMAKRRERRRRFLGDG